MPTFESLPPPAVVLLAGPVPRGAEAVRRRDHKLLWEKGNNSSEVLKYENLVDNGAGTRPLVNLLARNRLYAEMFRIYIICLVK